MLLLTCIDRFSLLGPLLLPRRRREPWRKVEAFWVCWVSVLEDRRLLKQTLPPPASRRDLTMMRRHPASSSPLLEPAVSGVWSWLISECPGWPRPRSATRKGTHTSHLTTMSALEPQVWTFCLWQSSLSLPLKICVFLSVSVSVSVYLHFFIIRDLQISLSLCLFISWSSRFCKSLCLSLSYHFLIIRVLEMDVQHLLLVWCLVFPRPGHYCQQLLL